MTFTAPTIPQHIYGEANVRLGRIEATYNVTILFAVESGSRAWGFPSPDSDNDVRFFYVHPVSRYLGLEAPRDVIETPIDGLWDVNGWDLGKALRLAVNGNSTAAEWLQSPLIYREHGPFPYKLRDLIKRHASPQASAKHYYGLTTTCYKKDIEKGVTAVSGPSLDAVEVNQKKYLYAIRGASCLAWIERYKEVPPMTLPALMAQDIYPEQVRAAIMGILERKATMGEFGVGRRIPHLDVFIQEKLTWVKETGMDKTPISTEYKREANQLLLDALGIG